MLTLNIRFGEEPIETTFFQIKAVMLYPEDTIQQQIYVRLHQGLRAEQKSGQYTCGLSPLDNLLRKELYALKEADIRERFGKGWIAGGILVLIKQLFDYRRGSEASVKKAIHILMQQSETGAIPHPVPMKRTSQQGYWSLFKSVAHLWADVYLRDVYLRKKHVIHKEYHEQISSEEIGTFLARAEQFRRFGEQHIAPRTKPPTTTLAAENTWKVPASLMLPVINLAVPSLTTQQRRILQTYKNPNFPRRPKAVR